MPVTPTLDGDTDEDDEDEEAEKLPTGRLAYCSLHVCMPGGGCSLTGEANGEATGDDEFEIVLAAEGRGDVEGLNSMPESFDCSV